MNSESSNLTMTMILLQIFSQISINLPEKTTELLSKAKNKID